MFHKSKELNCKLAAPLSSVIEPVQQIVEEEIDGVIVQRAVIVPVDVASRKAELSLPKASDYTLEKLIEAGVDLQHMNVMSFFKSTDPFDADFENDAQASKLFKELLDSESKVDTKVDPNANVVEPSKFEN